MHQLFAMAVFLVLTVRTRDGLFFTAQQQLAYVLGGILARAATFIALHIVLFLGARLLWPKDRLASFTATRLNYLTLALSVFAVFAQTKH